MTPADLRRYGEALYGPRWQTSLARALDVSDRTMRYWLSGRQMPEGVERDIRALVAQKRNELRGL